MHLCIEYSKPDDHNDSIVARFKLRDNSMVPLWAERMQTAISNYTIDDPARFYGLNDKVYETNKALKSINECISTINSYQQIIEKALTDINDSDTLNYLHHIFEVYHGLLDQQKDNFFSSAPDNVKEALAFLNICVHRCESVARGSKPRQIVTYYDMPKIKTLNAEHYTLFTDMYQFGTIYLNYVEIGKTLEDLAQDNDSYIGVDAFRPYTFYSADFMVSYFDSNLDQVLDRRKLMREHFLSNSKFFLDKGFYFGDPRLNPGRIPLADLDSHGRDILNLLVSRQYVKSVSFE